MPTDRHQAILQYLLFVLQTYLAPVGGVVRCAPLRLHLWTGKFREPDLLLLRSATDPRRHDEYWEGADLVVEILSPSNSDHDLVTKRTEYAKAGIPEYWIVDPRKQTIMVLELVDDRYVEHGFFARGTMIQSVLLPDLEVSVDAVFDAD